MIALAHCISNGSIGVLFECLVAEEREVLRKAGLSVEADPENYLGGSSETMYFIGLDVHKKTISYCVKDAAGCVHGEGKIGSTRRELDAWVRTLPQPRMIAMEATIFTGWIYDHLLPHAESVKVAHPLMLRAIAAAKKKNDRIDAAKIADCLRCDFLPECHMAPTEIRDRRRILRYRNLVQRQTVQMKNRISGLLMETGVTYDKLRLHPDGLLQPAAVQQRRDRGQCPAPAEAVPGAHRSLDPGGQSTASIAAPGSVTDRASEAFENRSGCWPDHGSDLGAGGGGHIALPVHQAGRQLLRTVRRGEELGRQGDAYADLQTT